MPGTRTSQLLGIKRDISGELSGGTQVRGLWLALAVTLVAHPTLAIDCGRAKSETENATCGDAEARVADQDKAFDRIRTLLPDDERTSLRHHASFR